LPDYCTCGAELPPDALFCHKCGKPQREILVPEVPPPPAYTVEAQPTFVVPPSAAAPAPGFRNPVAMKIAILVAIFATLLSFLPYLNWLAAGFFAVFFYRRRTGALLNMESGVRMGWMTGVIMFGIMALLLSFCIVFFHIAGGLGAIQSQLQTAVDPRVMEALKLLENGREVFLLFIQLFVFTTLLSMAGGALAAKTVGRS
jgi:hypothetical protein